MNSITVVPSDHIIIVDGVVLTFDYQAPQDLRALHWDGNSGHTEWTSSPNKYLTDADYESQVKPFYTSWLKEKERIEEEKKLSEEEYNSLESVKKRKIEQIDQETSNKILAGFDYNIDGMAYHFSYDSFDQQNFVDTVSMCQLSLLDTSGVPATVTWNSYLADGTLVQHQFDAKTFTDLYVNGAMKHKATQMDLGGQRKLAVEKAQTVEEVEKI